MNLLQNFRVQAPPKQFLHFKNPKVSWLSVHPNAQPSRFPSGMSGLSSPITVARPRRIFTAFP